MANHKKPDVEPKTADTTAPDNTDAEHPDGIDAENKVNRPPQDTDKVASEADETAELGDELGGPA